MSDKKVIVGIDLGTTFSIISHFREGKPEPIPDQATSNFTIPSAVYFPETGEPIVGVNALRHEAMNPENLVQWIKRSIGEDYQKQIGDAEYTPEAISAEILKYLKQNAETYLGTSVDQAVITVPAYFGDRERAATEEAGRLAGLEVMQLLPEPVAAAFAYALEGKIEPGERNVLVYDLGGGTFDVTLLKATYQQEAENEMKLDATVLAKDGSRSLGGRDWDKVLIDYLAEQAQAQFEKDLLANLHSEADLRDKANEAKHQLSDYEETIVVIDAEGNHIKLERSTFEEITEGLLYQTEEKLNHVMEEAQSQHNLGWSDLDIILLVGGATRMPMVRSMLERVTAAQGGDIPIELHRQVDLTVSLGAAYFAQMLSEGEMIIPPEEAGALPIIVHADFVDTVKAIGVLAEEPQPDGTYKRINVIVIPDGSETDTEFTVDGLGTRHDNQTSVTFEITEGDSEIPDEVQALGRVALTGLPPNRPAGRPLKVLLTYNKNGIIIGKGIDVDTGQMVEIRIDRQAIQSA
jgi:molecular chaperone DnaK